MSFLTKYSFNMKSIFIGDEIFSYIIGNEGEIKNFFCFNMLLKNFKKFNKIEKKKNSIRVFRNLYLEKAINDFLLYIPKDKHCNYLFKEKYKGKVNIWISLPLYSYLLPRLNILFPYITNIKSHNLITIPFNILNSISLDNKINDKNKLNDA